MKNWVIFGIVGVLGYGVYKYYQQAKIQAAASNTAAQIDSIVAAASLVANPSGVPSFNTTPISSDPQDLYAYQMNNPLASVQGSTIYTPAFGPQQNQPSGSEVTTW